MSQWDDGPRCYRGFTMATHLPVAPWRVPRRPLAALALLLSTVAAPVFQATTLFRQWLIIVLMKCEGSGNVTGMTWACQCGPAGRSVSHTDIWKDMEHQPLAAFSRKGLIITWAGFCWIICNIISPFSYWQIVIPESGFLYWWNQIKSNANPIKVQLKWKIFLVS